MKKISLIGLRNPEMYLKNTRHNLGSIFVKYFMDQSDEDDVWTQCKDYSYKSFNKNDIKIIAIISNHNINLSGICIIRAMKKFGLKKEEILVCHDDSEIDFGKFKFKNCGSAAGHNGIRHIISCIGDDFKRMRLGIGPRTMPLCSYVLSKFNDGEMEILGSKLQEMYNAAQCKISDLCCSNEEKEIKNGEKKQ